MNWPHTNSRPHHPALSSPGRSYGTRYTTTSILSIQAPPAHAYAPDGIARVSARDAARRSSPYDAVRLVIAITVFHL
ncbi:MAG: hypothetical protein HY232_15105 [Acidobacteria bacterium]|nr:hypothetical protein [Acidobacteriota bacterium]